MKGMQLIVIKIKHIATKTYKIKLNKKTKKKFPEDKNKTTKLEKYNIRN